MRMEGVDECWIIPLQFLNKDYHSFSFLNWQMMFHVEMKLHDFRSSLLKIAFCCLNCMFSYNTLHKESWDDNLGCSAILCLSEGFEAFCLECTCHDIGASYYPTMSLNSSKQKYFYLVLFCLLNTVLSKYVVHVYAEFGVPCKNQAAALPDITWPIFTSDNHLRGVDYRERDLPGHPLAVHSHFGMLPREIKALVGKWQSFNTSHQCQNKLMSFVEVCSKYSH